MNTGARVARWIFLSAMSVACAAAWADPPGETKVQNRLATDFTVFAGSRANANALVTGLRTGDPVVLTSPGTPGRPPTTTTFDPPTRPMGNGNVRISLALARQELANAGITHPTPAQIQTAMMGGTITTGSGATARTTTFPGVLVQRSQGMGWGQIAHSQGMKLGEVMRNARRADHDRFDHDRIARAHHRREFEDRDRAEHRAGRRDELREHAERGDRAKPVSTQASGRGIVTALGTSSAAGAVKPSSGRAGAGEHGAASAAGAGIVNGSGAAVAGASAGGPGMGGGHGKH